MFGPAGRLMLRGVFEDSFQVAAGVVGQLDYARRLNPASPTCRHIWALAEPEHCLSLPGFATQLDALFSST